MKTIIILTATLLLFCSLALGQGNIYYEYDAAGLDTFVKGGLNASAWDFAYTDIGKYKKKSAGDHIKLFGTAGAFAMVSNYFVNSLPNGSTRKVNHAIGTFAISLYEFNLQGYWKGKAPLVSGISEPNKAGVLWLKWTLGLGI